MIYVIGSGPSGVAAAKLILEKGFKVTILDSGLTLEDEISKNIAPLKDQSKSAWNPDIISLFKDKISADPKGIQKKLVYGSEYPYQALENYFSIESKNTGNFAPSYAKAGFSNVWGSAVLPYTAKDIENWPIKIDTLHQYYSSVLRFMPLTWTDDNFASHFPSFTDRKNELSASKQASYILANLNKHSKEFSDNNILFSKSRLAVDAGEKQQSNCVYCGLCLFGCPKQIIYSTNSTLKELAADPNFAYKPNVVVTKLDEEGAGVTISGFDRITGESLKLSGDKCFLGAGVVSSTQILLNSKSIYDKPVDLKVSEYFLAPVFTMKAFRNVQDEELHTLAQVFFEVIDQEISKHYVHVQLYSYSEIYKLALSRMIKLLPFKKFIMPEILGRMMAIQGYLHSDYSSRIEAVLDRQKLKLEGKVNPDGAKIIKKIVSKLNSLNKYSDLFIFKPMLQIGLPGEGRHVGGSFAMSENPGDFGSDLLGRPFGWKNIHIIDSSVFPTIPAPTITFTAMANAQRIADLSL